LSRSWSGQDRGCSVFVTSIYVSGRTEVPDTSAATVVHDAELVDSIALIGMRAASPKRLECQGTLVIPVLRRLRLIIPFPLFVTNIARTVAEFRATQDAG